MFLLTSLGKGGPVIPYRMLELLCPGQASLAGSGTPCKLMLQLRFEVDLVLPHASLISLIACWKCGMSSVTFYLHPPL